MPSKSNRNASRKNNSSPSIYSVPVQRDELDGESTFLSPPPPTNVPQPLDDPPGHGNAGDAFGFGDDVERDGVGGLIQFDGEEEDLQATVKDREQLSAPSPLTLEPPTQLPPVPTRHERHAISHTRHESNGIHATRESEGRSDIGHRRAPVMAREPTMLESFSRTVRTYVPSSIPIPSAAPSPPRVSRPVSFGSFMSSSPALRGDRHPSAGSPGYDPVVLDSDEEGEPRGVVAYPGAKDEEDVVWAGWDTLRVEAEEKARRVLMLGYREGLQIWDCTNLASVTEILNIRDSAIGRVVFAAVLPPPALTLQDDFVEERPLVGIIYLKDGASDSDMLVYSLHSHTVVRQLLLPGADSFQATSRLIVVATTAPPELHVLSPSFVPLFTIPSTHLTPLLPHTHPIPHPDPKNPVPNDVEESDVQYRTLAVRPRPVFCLSQRLLAFSSPPPSDTPLPTSPVDRAPFGITHAELGSAAVKMGGSVLSGVKSLGGLAYSAARARLGGGAEAEVGTPSAGLTSMFFSKSAPAASGGGAGHGRSYSESVVVDRARAGPKSAVDLGAKGSYVTVLDTGALPAGREPTVVSRFMAFKDQAVSSVGFSRDGVSVMVAPRDGQVMKVFALMPSAKSTRSPFRLSNQDQDNASASSDAGDVGAPMHVYDLRRGRTSAVVEGVESAQDGRWVAMGTRKRTLHVFAANPYGGKTDVRSHVEGRVRDAGEVQPLSTCLTPIVRLRFRARQSRLAVPLSFTFVHSSELSVPGNLLPPPLSYPSSPKSLSVQSGSPAGALKPLSPTPVYHRPTNFQDLLVFDPDDGSLSLRRFTLEESVGEQGLAIPGSIPIVGGVSVSLPAGVGRTGSPSSRSDHSSPKHSSGLGHVMERTGEMVAKEHVVATWSLRRSREWPEVRHVVKAEGSRPASVTRRKDWLAHAELSTCSRSKRLVPRAVYLSHQFTFHALGEDYHALVRRYQFDVPATKIEVRREVQASAYTMGLGESFVQGAHGAIDVRAAPSSFDEPLASAISAGLEYHNPYPPVIPMFPNGAPGSWSSGMKSIPIRSVASGISDGMNESFGRIRREFGRVRSPKMGARVDHGMVMSVPLEFDEEDEDFILPGKTASDTDAISRSGSGGSESIPTPSTHAQLLGDGDNADVEVWDADAGWTQEDRQAVDDAERFDDLVVGFMDEEQVKPEPPAVTPAMSGKGKRKAKRRM